MHRTREEKFFTKKYVALLVAILVFGFVVVPLFMRFRTIPLHHKICALNTGLVFNDCYFTEDYSYYHECVEFTPKGWKGKRVRLCGDVTIE